MGAQCRDCRPNQRGAAGFCRCPAKLGGHVQPPDPSSDCPTARKGVLFCGGYSMRTADHDVVAKPGSSCSTPDICSLRTAPRPEIASGFVTVESARAVSSH